MADAEEDAPLATVLDDEGRVGLQYLRRLAHPPEKVWRALTESEHLQHWMPCDLIGERRAGARLELPFWPAHVEKYGIETPTLQGEIRAWDPPRLFEWTWDTDVLRWELEAVDGGTVLTFTTWLGDDRMGGDLANTGAGYHVCLDHLAAWLDDEPRGALVDADVGPWEARYTAAVEAALEGRRGS
jgi:uncharacterized protein YndB with AHSA1/START domain